SVWELFWPLQVGARLVIAVPDGHRDPAYLARVMADQSVTTAHFVPSMLAVFVAHLAAAAEAVGSASVATSEMALSKVFASGEALPASTAAALREVLPGARLHNLYGPTEAAVDVTFHEVTEADTITVPIGAPVWNTQVFVLDARLRPVPVGVAGELYLSGAQLARGYVGRADLSSDRFVANPFVPGTRMYRTGDLVSWNGAGELEYIGRTDFQVKLRGLRIELGEIETALLAQESVAQSVVVLHRDDRVGEALVAYLVPAGATEPDQGALKSALQAALPAYMVPSAFVVLEAFPLNASGKLDRKALPAPMFEATVFRLPSTPAEELVAGVFADLLGVERVGADDDFFALGGNSLVATQVTARLGSLLDSTVELRTLFEAPTVAELAERLSSGTGSRRRVPLVAADRPDDIPLSLAQQRMWFLSRFDSASGVNNIPAAIRLSGRLDTAALQAAVGDLVARHEILRTVYPVGADGSGTQVILPVGDTVPDLTPIDVDESDLIRKVTSAVVTGFDVTAEVPLRVNVFRVTETEHVLVVVVHHIAADGFSMGPLVRDVMVAYTARVAGEAPGWAPLDVQYADYALWQREVLGSEDDGDSVVSGQLDYWRTALDGIPAQLDLPADRPRPAVASNVGGAVSFDIDADLHAALLGAARTRGASLFMVVHTALAALLARLSGTTDIAIGTPVAGRGEQALDDLVGMFVNTLVLRTQVNPATPLTTLLADVRQTDLGAFGHADVPFERIVEVIDPPRSQARHPLFQVALFFQNHQQPSIDLDGLTVSGVDVDAVIAKFDLQVTVTERNDDSGVPSGMAVHLSYARDLFDEGTIDLFGRRLTRMLETLATDPSTPVGDVELLGDDELSRILTGWNDSRHDVDAGELLLDAYDAQVAATPDATAVVYEGDSLTYAEFDARVNRLARRLVADGVGPESLVAIAIRRSLDLVVAIYAVVRAGGAYVPVDPDHPAERIGHILDTAQPVCVLTTTTDDFAAAGDFPVVAVDTLDLADLSSAPVTDADRRGVLRPQHPAYVIFTSGSTGKPKGVAVPHAAIANQIAWMLAEYPLGAGDVYLQKTATTFDVSLWGWFIPLRSGATLVVATPDGHRDPQYVADTIREQRVTATDFVPSMLTVFAGSARPEDLTSLRYVFVIGEALPAETVRDFRSVSDAGVHNLYGPTEAAVSITYADVTDTAVGGAVSIGRPEWNSQVYVLDSRLRPVPVGVPGELYLGGVQLARGYFGRVDLTSDRFVANPFSSRGARMYRTGDLVVWDADGGIDYIGRTDFQVKFRGQRIELGDIETALLAHPTVLQAAVLVVKTETGDHLVAYLVPAPGADIDADEVKVHATGTLPSYMVPSALVVLDSFPLNASGKLDRKALPAPVFAAREFRAPVTATEQTIASVFAEVLGAPQVGRGDDFFELGGNSLIATQVAARLGAALGFRVPVRDLFEASTVEALADRLAGMSGGEARIELAPRPRPERVPLSPAQSRMWFLNRFDPESAVYNIPLAVRLTGELDVAALRAAVADVIARHEVLRTTYPEHEGTGRQVVVPDFSVDIAAEPVAAEDLTSRVLTLVGTGFDVTQGVPVRAALLGVDGSATDHVLVVVMHHISGDGFSTAPLTRDLVLAYLSRSAGSAPAWEPLAVQYADYTLWQREVLGSLDDPQSQMSAQLDYWTRVLRGTPDVLVLPTDRPRPAVMSNIGALREFTVDKELREALEALARRSGATLFMVLHAALAVLLSRLSGTSDITVGTPVAGRGEAALDDLVGMFVNTLVLRTEVPAAASFDEVLAAAREADLGAFGHADLPFEQIVEALDPVRSQAYSPLFQVTLSLQNLPAPAAELGDLSISGLTTDMVLAKFDLDFGFAEAVDENGNPSGLDGALTYTTGLYDASGAQSLVDGLLGVLRAVTADPAAPVGDIDLLGDRDRVRVLHEWNATGVGVSGGTLDSLFAEQAARTPDAVAVTDGAVSLTYGQLLNRVDVVARRLIGRGVGVESRVAVAMRRSIDQVVAMYAIVRAGGAYVPVDPDQPLDRIRYVLDTAAPQLVVVDAGSVVDRPVIEFGELAADADVPVQPVTDADRIGVLRPDNTAYVLFTSGSTGRPKGVAVSHAATVNQLVSMQREYGLDGTDSVLQKTAFTFDASVWEFFWPLQSGARLVLAAPDGHRDPQYLARVLVEESVTTVQFVPSMLPMVLTALPDSGAPALRRVFAGGEALPSELAAEVEVLTGARVYNLYGPTEAAMQVTRRAAREGDPVIVPIGGPVEGTRVYVLDGRLQPVPVGVPGELYLAGVQLARGYESRPDLTADRFVASPFAAGERLYRTGDLVRWLESVDGSGELEFLGRTDFQVKLHGLRIELGEVEAALAAHPAVRQAVASVVETSAGQVLVGYVAGVVDVDAVSVTAVAGERLPAYMVPTRIVVLDGFPVNASGKIDRKSLPAPVFEAREFRAPTTAVEQAVADVFAELLGAPRVGLDDDFFELGGNSLVAMQAVSRLGAAVDATVPVRALFDASTVADLAAFVAGRAGQGRRAPLVPQPRTGPVPLSLPQQRMWFLNKFEPRSAAFNIPMALRLTGDLDIAAMNAAFVDVLERHEILRTVFPDTGAGVVQVVLPTGDLHVDLTPEDVTTAELPARAVSSMSDGFDVTVEIPVRVCLLRLVDGAEDEYVLVVVVHHIAADGWSMGPLARDLMTAYVARGAGETPGWAPLPVQYADFTLWQREVLGSDDDPGSVISTQLAYWQRQLAGVPDQLELPWDRPRPAVQSYDGGLVTFEIGGELHARLVEVARERGATLFMLMHAAFAVLLARLSATDDIAIGTPIAGRGDEALDDLVGVFINALVLRAKVDVDAGFDEILAGVRETDLSAFGNADVPFERLVEVLNPVRSTSRSPLAQVGFLFQNMAPTELELDGLTVGSAGVAHVSAKYDLQLALRDEYGDDGVPSGMFAEMVYATALFDASTVEVIGQRLVRVLEAIAADPTVVVGDIDLVEADEVAALVTGWNATDHELPAGQLLQDGFLRQAQQTPDATAVVYEGETLTYAELSARVGRLARRLIDEGVGPESLVALAVRRSLDLVVAIYAVLEAGGAYVPIDPDHPAERIGHILDTANPVCILTTGDARFDVPRRTVLRIDDIDLSRYDAGPVDQAERVSHLRQGHPAYVIFTSGSTGKPKGVAVPHGAIVNQMEWMQSEYRLDSADVYLQKTATTFDVSLWGWFMPLRVGATLVVATPDGHRDPQYVADRIAEHSVTVTDFVPSMLTVFAASVDPQQLVSLTRIFVIGEALPAETVRDFARVSPARVHNLYGPTEAAVSITYRDVTGGHGDAVSIGWPQWNSQVHVLDSRLNPVPVGVPGELYLGGDQLARGYFGRVDLTSDRFVANPFSGGAGGDRMYRTGDLVAWDKQGELRYIGRTDFQVKFRGQRIELGEIETAVLTHPRVLQSAVLVVGTPTGDQLVAYVVPTPGDTVTADDVKAAASRSLPTYMIPASVTVLDAFPLNPSGKLDRKALPAPVFEARAFRAPETETEAAVASVFSEVLGIERVGLDDDFFELGGNSLIATQVVSRLTATCGVRVPVLWLFSDATTEAFARRIDAERLGSGGTGSERAFDVLLPIREGRSPEAVFCLHPVIGLSWAFAGLSQHLDPQYGIYGLQSPAFSSEDEMPGSIAEWAARYIREIRTVQPDGPYRLVGWSLGGVIAHEMAVQLQAQGEEVALLSMMDSFAGAGHTVQGRAMTAGDLLGGLLPEAAFGGFGGEAELTPEAVSALAADLPEPFGDLGIDRIERAYRAAESSLVTMGRHRPGIYKGDLVYFAAAADDPTVSRGADTWANGVDGRIEVHAIDETHWGMASPEALGRIAGVVARSFVEQRG
ncbi:amino acid adenylation domain-containing protein, partial [Rhodococcus gannanensis]